MHCGAAQCEGQQEWCDTRCEQTPSHTTSAKVAGAFSLDGENFNPDGGGRQPPRVDPTTGSGRATDSNTDDREPMTHHTLPITHEDFLAMSWRVMSSGSWVFGFRSSVFLGPCARSLSSCQAPAHRPPREQTPAEERALERAVPVHSAPTEPRHLPRRVEARDRLAVLRQDAPGEI